MADNEYKYLDNQGLLYFWQKIKAAFVGSVQYDSTNKKITQTKNGSTTDVVTLSTLKSAMSLDSVANGAEVNQNAFSNVKVDSITVAADAKTDTLELVAGDHVTITADATNDKITIDATGAVESVAGKTGVVTLSKSDVGLDNVDNTADASKSVASAAKLTSTIDIEGIKFDGSTAVSHYATCGTAATTAAKVATITPTTSNFELVTGARVYVKFTYAISVASATLNVNGTGAKYIYYNGNTLASGLTDANGTYEFVYNGTQWELIGDLDTNTTYQSMTQTEANTGTATANRTMTATVLHDTIVAKSVPYASCSTDGATAAKTVTVNNFVLEVGSKVIVRFENTNSASRSDITLNVNSTGDKTIRYKDGTIPYESILYAGSVYMFVYDGGDWEIVGDLFDKNEIPSYESKAAASGGTAESLVTTGEKYTWNSKASTVSPTFTGTPKAPTATAGTNTTQIATTAFVTTAVANAISGISGISYQIVTDLPATGAVGVIYLIAHSHGTRDAYDEYIWTGTAFEKIGNTDVDLSGYVQASEMVAVTNSEIDTIVAS